MGLLYGWNQQLPAILAAAMTAVLAVDCALSFRIARAIGNKLEQLDKLSALIKEQLDRLPSAEDVVLMLESTLTGRGKAAGEPRDEGGGRIPARQGGRRPADQGGGAAGNAGPADAGNQGAAKTDVAGFSGMRRPGIACAADDWRDKLHIRSKTRGRKEDQR